MGLFHKLAMLITTVVMLIAGYFIYPELKYNPVGWIFGDIRQVKEQQLIPMVTGGEAIEKKEIVKVEKETKKNIEVIQQHESEKIYQYKDKNGTLSFTDNTRNIPKETNIQRVWESRKGQGRETQVIIDRNRVLVPVKITSGGIEKEFLLLLDTGATNTVIYSDAAQGLKIRNQKTGSATMADGRTVPQIVGEVEAVAVGPMVARNQEIRIMHQIGQKHQNGLLGMNFLQNFKYTIDINRSSIRWN